MCATAKCHQQITSRTLHIIPQASSDTDASERRILMEEDSLTDPKADLCSLIPISVVRLTTEDSLDSHLTLEMTHRVDLSDQNCACTKCSARNTPRDIVLPQGKQPGLLLSHVFFSGGKVLQKYYK